MRYEASPSSPVAARISACRARDPLEGSAMNSVVDSGVPRRNFDVIVVGGGVVGLSVAYYLSERRGVKVAVIERGRFGRGAEPGLRRAWLRPNARSSNPVPFSRLP